MKKLIQCNLAKDHVKSTNTIESLHNFSKFDHIQSFEKVNKDEPINNNLTSIKATQHNIVQNKNGCLREKYQAQQVSVLYSEHIYKTSQRDFMMEAQLEKYKAMLQSEKKKKMKLLAQQREWKIQKQKLMEEKKLILFALDSLSVKIEDDQMKNQKELRKQTVEFFKARFNTSQSENKIKHGQSRFKTEKENIENDSMSSSCQKLNFLKNLKKQLSIDESKDTSKQIHQMKDADEIKIVQTQYGQLEIFQQQMQKYQQEINGLRRQSASNKKIICQLQQKLEEQTDKLKNMQEKHAQQRQENEKLNKKIEYLMNKQMTMTKQLQEKQDRIVELERQLKLTLESYQEREQKQKQHVQSLQRFTKDLKLNDQKIQQFLKNQFGIDESNNEVCGSKKAYHQHISYILHLCKKKQTVYDHIIEELKEKMKEDNFRMSIVEKKLKNFSKYHEQLRYYAQNENKDVVFRSILRFGH